MRILAAGLLLAITLPAGAGEQCVAVDGDSLVCGAQRVRVAHIYAPEKGEPGYEEATRRLQARIDSGVVTLEPKALDRRRVVAKVYVDGVQIRQRDIGPRAGRGSGHGRPGEPTYHPVK